MRLIKGLLICVLATGGMVGCSDDTTSTKKDKGVVYDQKVVDSSVDMGVDSTKPTPDGAPDQLVKQDTGPTPDTGPKVDLPVVDQGPTPDLPQTDTTVVTPDQAVPNPDQGAGGNATCANAQLLTFAGGAVTVNGDTTGATDQFPTLACKYGYGTSTITMDGPQLYYKFSATKDQWYKVLLTSTFANAHAVIFTSATCTEADIQTDCQSGGLTGEFSEDVDDAKTRATYFKAPATGMVYVAVDSESAAGAFTLSVEEMATVTNGTCATPTALTFFNGKATLRGDLGPKITPNEYATDIVCGSTSAYDEAQAYYKFTATAGKAYKITVKSDSAGWLYSYAFQAASCGTAAAINTDCATAKTSSYADNGKTITYVFAPAAAGDYIIAVDTKYNDDYGGFSLTVEDFTPPTNGACATPTAITLTAGAATVQGSTLGLTDEYPLLDCGGFTVFDGPQAYYEFLPTAGKYYKVTLKPTFSAYAYWFIKASCGTVASMNADCGGTNGGKMGSISSGATGSMIISGQSAPLLIGVDSSDPGTAGDFELTIEEVIPPANDTCATATALTLTNGTVSVTGDNSLATDQSNLPSSGCTGGTTPGADLFYSVAVQAGKTYAIRVDATFDSAPYILDGCTTSTCLLGVDNNFSSGLETMIYAPTADATVIIVVDPYSASGKGSFTLEVTEVIPPTNNTCATAEALTLTAGKATVTGDTTLATNDFSLASSSCTGDTSPGNEVFYSIPVTASVPVTVELDATFDSVLYLLDACGTPPTCLAGADNNFGSGIETLTFTPTTTGTVIIGVDGYDTGDYGTFTLKINP